jgi:hypothetical protein
MIANKVHEKYRVSIDPKIIVSINSSFMKNYIIEHYNNLSKYSNKILNDYNNINVLKLSEKYDLSPVTIIKFIFEKKYNMKLNKITKNIKILNDYDKKQLYTATSNDAYYTLDQTNQQQESINFEKKVEEFLIKNNIKYSTQEQLTKEQIEKYGNAINTPDFLIESEFSIDGMKIHWIDAKNFYGANIRFIKNKIIKQTRKYIETYGDGCIVFNLGHNEILKIDNVLCVSYQDILN